MLKMILILLIPLSIFAKVHYAKVEPYESVMLKSSVSGLVTRVDLSLEGTMVDSKKVIQIDDALDKLNLKSSNKSVKLLEEMLKINKEIEKSLKKSSNKQQNHFKRISRLSTSSKAQKDSAFNAFVSAKTKYLSTREKIVNLEKQILDIRYKIAQLKDSINKKSISLENKYLYKLMVSKGDFVNPGSSLAQIKNANRAKLTLFLESEEIKDIEEKIVYIDGEKTDYKVNKVWRIADEKFISSYRAEIYIPAPKRSFSKLIKVEIK